MAKARITLPPLRLAAVVVPLNAVAGMAIMAVAGRRVTAAMRTPLHLRAAAEGGVQPPAVAAPRQFQDVPLPRTEPKFEEPSFGFVRNAELLNSRAAMIGFFALLLVEAVLGGPFLKFLGIEVGNGIDIGF